LCAYQGQSRIATARQIKPNQTPSPITRGEVVDHRSAGNSGYTRNAHNQASHILKSHRCISSRKKNNILDYTKWNVKKRTLKDTEAKTVDDDGSERGDRTHRYHPDYGVDTRPPSFEIHKSLHDLTLLEFWILDSGAIAADAIDSDGFLVVV
jgi:hypothetical protein